MPTKKKLEKHRKYLQATNRIYKQKFLTKKGKKNVEMSMEKFSRQL